MPLPMKPQRVCIWRRLIVTVFTGMIGMRCSSDGVNLPGPRDGIQLSAISAHSISSSSTHTHFDTSSSMFCNPPHPHPKRPRSPASCLLPYSIDWFSDVTLPEHTTSGVSRYRRQTCAAAAKSNQRWLISGSLLIKQAFIDHYTETIYLLFHPQTVWQLIGSDRRWLPHHCLSFIRL